MERAFRKRGIRVITGARFDPSAVSVDGDGVRVMVAKEGEEPAELRAERMLVATGRAANTDDVGPRVDQGRGRARRRQGRWGDADRRPAPLCDRRHHRRAVARARRGARGHRRGPRDRRAGGRAGRLPEDAARDLQPTAGGVDRALRAGVRARRDPGPRRQVPVPGERQGDHQRRHVRVRQGHRACGARRDPRRAHDRRRT